MSTTRSTKTRPLHFHFSVFTGEDAHLNTAPEAEQVRFVAETLMRGQWKEATPDTVDLVIHMPFGSFRVVNHEGDTEHYTGERPSIAGI